MRLLILFAFCLFGDFVSAQTLKQWKSLATEAQAQENYLAASAYWYEVMQLDSTTFEHASNYALSLRGSRDYSKALYYFEKNYKKDRGRLFPLGQYYIAEMQQLTGDYKNALRNYKKFYSRNRNKSFKEVRLAELGIENCTWALKLRTSQNIDFLERLPGNVNTPDSEFAPALFNDSTFFYSSLKSDFKLPGISIYMAKRTDSIYQTDPTFSFNITETALEGEEVAYGNLAFSPDQTRAYFSKCNDLCAIYECDVINGEFINFRPIGVLLDGECTASMPYVGLYKGVEYLFYTSNRSGTRGDLDIWWSERRNGEWQAPVNAGDNINTSGKELSPFFMDEQLYFSSDAHRSLGGLDILRSEGYPRSFDLPENLGTPINSSYNDLYYSYSKVNNEAYFASNRPENKDELSCCNDLFHLAFSDSIASQEEKERAYASLKELNDYLPVTLYFHNDEPNPNTRDTTTKLGYLDAFDSYLQLKKKYLRESTSGLSGEDKENALLDMESFFEFRVEKGAEDLAIFQELLLEELEAGSAVELTIKGFASPRAESDYNTRLTKRRIQSLVNHLERWEKGVLLPYIRGEAANGALLTFKAAPFGEDRAQTGVNDQLDNEKASIYSTAASLERKIEILSVQRVQSPSEVLIFETDSIFLGRISSREIQVLSYSFQNVGSDSLHIDSIQSPCGCTLPKMSKKHFAPGERGEVLLEYDPAGQRDIQQKVIQIFYNSAVDPKRIVFTAVVQ